MLPKTIILRGIFTLSHIGLLRALFGHRLTIMMKNRQNLFQFRELGRSLEMCIVVIIGNFAFFMDKKTVL